MVVWLIENWRIVLGGCIVLCVSILGASLWKAAQDLNLQEQTIREQKQLIKTRDVAVQALQKTVNDTAKKMRLVASLDKQYTEKVATQRTRYRTLTKEVTRYVDSSSPVSNCVPDAEFVRLYNDAVIGANLAASGAE